MKPKFLITAAFLAALTCTSGHAASTADPAASKLLWSVQSQWELSSKPVDIVHTLDGKQVFVLTDQHTVQVYGSNGKLKGTVPVSEGVTAIDIAPQGEFLYLVDSNKNTFSSLSIDFIKDINISGSPFKGNPNAPVTIAVFTDFECPYCGKAVPRLEQVLERNPESVKIVLKNMPLPNHKFATEAASAALAAEEQGKFWEFHDELFASSKINSKVINDIAIKLALDMEKYEKAKSSQRIRQKISTDLQDANKAGVTGTPTIFINGRLLKNRSLQGFQEVIENELSQTDK